ncbi:hypothetical protein ARMGADRAFT_1010638 [Armillaria gallica]|uniref:Uncharacterized protein n=1 Tax=Armillaria gallica TaxID=47427 RepID=A0A2H3E571_ARMGA|nr:hypothetical protein ARMGADRAFT_1010638 [Armillaria gallica]
MSSFLLRREHSCDSDDTVLLVVVIFTIVVVGLCIVFACFFLYRRARSPPRPCTVDPPATVMHINFEKGAERDVDSIPTENQDELRGYWVLPALAFVPDAEKGTQTETSNEEGPPK